MPGPSRFGSFAWKWTIHSRLARMMSAIGLPSLAHRLHVEVQLAVRRVDQLRQVDAGCGGEHEIALGRAERLEGDRHAELRAGRDRAVQHFDRVGFGVVVRHARQQVPLLRRAEHHHLAAQVGAQFGERSQVLGRVAANGRVGAGEVEALGLGQQPMQADDFQPGVLGLRAHFDDPLGRHLPDVERLVVRRERKRRDFDARVTEFADCGKCVGKRPVAEHLVANGKLHRDRRRRSEATCQRLRLSLRFTILRVAFHLFAIALTRNRYDGRNRVDHAVQTELIPVSTLEIGKIHQGDCIELMQQIDAGTIDLVFADPPFNIGYEYDEYHDRQDDEEYIAWSRQWMEEVHRVLKPGGTFWLAIGDEYAAELKVDAEHKIGFSTRSWVVWYYTFGVNCTKKFSRSHVHLFHFVKDENNFTFNAEDPQVRVPSARALVYADKRANPTGRLPDDTWILRPQDLPDGFQPMDDTWYFARVAGTFKERQGFHGCQMPEQLLGPHRSREQQPGRRRARPVRRQRHDAGRGEEARPAVDRLRAVGRIRPRGDGAALQRSKTVTALDGPADPIASAPSTSNGRRLEEAELDGCS